MKKFLIVATLFSFTNIQAIANPLIDPSLEDETYTLYFDSKDNKNARYYLATFTSDQGEFVSRNNCNFVAQLSRTHYKNEVHFWCERGNFKK